MTDPGLNVNGNGNAAVTVAMAETADAALEAAMERLVPQLSSSAPPPTVAQLRRIIEDSATTLWTASVASDEGAPHIVGVLTLVVFTLPTGVRAWVEDVVVDDAARGAGIASALITAAIAYAERSGARTVDLTSRPHREAANRLYQRLGFAPRETNVYRYTPAAATAGSS
jgi:ribosomal protein S18 acetylase RimI-like enzyme